jgi:LDH2 family malate/lactate/ureidoglycolate dehydrogenase
MISSTGKSQIVSVDALRFRLFACLRSRGYESRAASLVADVLVFGCMDSNCELVLEYVQALSVLRAEDASLEAPSAVELERELHETVVCIATPPAVLPPTPYLRFVRAHKLVARLEGHGTDMTLVLCVATRTTLDRVAAHGLAVVSAFGQSCVALSILSYFARWISLRGHIALLVSGRAVHGGRFSRLRAVWGLPRSPVDTEPLVWDCSWNDRPANLDTVNNFANEQGAGVWAFLEFLVGPLIGASPSTLLSASEQSGSPAPAPWGTLIVALDRRLLLPSNTSASGGTSAVEGVIELMNLSQRSDAPDARAQVIRSALERTERRKQNLTSSSILVSEGLWSVLTEEMRQCV